MVTAGYPATVAPLGTALTEDQLGLLWKMADEPILCFDGDKAGQRAAYPRRRHGDAAVASPARACASRMLPDGQDPDDLYRSGGREAIAEVLARRAPARRDAVEPRDRSGLVRHAGAARRVRGARRTRWCAASAMNRCANITRQDFSARAARADGAAAGSGPRRASARRARDSSAASSASQSGPAISAISPAAGMPSAAAAGRMSRADGAAELAAVGEPDRARPPHRAAAARGADPGRGDQPSLAAGAPRRGVFRARVPQSRRRPPARGRCSMPRPAADAAEPAEALRAAIAARGLTGVLDRVEAAITHTSDWPAQAGRFGRRRGPMVDPRCYLASQAAHAK